MPSIPIRDEAEWLAFRDHHIGGSEVASLFYWWHMPDGSTVARHMWDAPTEKGAVCVGSVGAYKNGFRLWQEKAGRVKPESLAGVERVEAGNFLEPAIAAWAEMRFDWKLRKTRRYMTHPTVPGWGASLDYEMVSEGENYPPVEVKNIDRQVAMREWVIEGDQVIVPPLHINLQLQAQLGVGAAKAGWIAVVVGGNEIKVGEIKRHEPTQEKIAAAITAFWRSVHEGTAPERYADYDTIADIFFDGTVTDPPLDLTSDPALPLLCARYQRWHKHAKRVEHEMENIKGRIAGRLGLASRARAQGWRISWPAIHREEKVIPERLQKALDYRGALTISVDDGKKRGR